MKILGLDVSSASTGWAVLEDGQLLSESDCGFIQMRQKTHGERLNYFEQQLKSIIAKHQVEMIAIEDVWAGKFIQPALILSRYRGVAEKVCWEHFKCEPLVRTATDFRKLVGLKHGTNLLPGKKEKVQTGLDSKMLTFQLMKRVFNLTGFDFAKHNDATDALCVALGAHLIGTDLGKAADAETAAKKAAKKEKAKSAKKRK